MRKSIPRSILACVIGMSFTIGILFILHIRARMDIFITLSSETGIPVKKQLLLEYFYWLPWPIVNWNRIIYFRETGYPHEMEPDTIPVIILITSLIFFIGTLLTVFLNGGKKLSPEENLRWKPWKRGILLPPWLSMTSPHRPPLWVVFTLLTVGAHLLLMGVAATYYTGPGGPVWVYPSPLWLLFFIIGVGWISYFTQGVYNQLQKIIRSR